MVDFEDYLKEGFRVFVNSWKTRLFNQKYEGNTEEICEKIIRDCWNKRYFQTSVGNFPQFWTRDFGWCTASLVKLGYVEEVHQTLRYALNRFRNVNKITTTISPQGKPFDFPYFAVDSLPWLIHSIVKSKFPYYVYKDFLNQEIIKYFKKVIQSDGLVKSYEQFSSMKDFSIRKSSCYDNSMVGLLAKDLKKTKLVNPLKDFDYPLLIKENFWNGQYFYDDLSKKDYLASDSNIFPFVCGLIQDKDMLLSVVNLIKEKGLDLPFPLKYTGSRENVNFIWQELFLRNYESNAIWTHMGPLYIKLVQQVDKSYAQMLKNRYRIMIEKNHNYLEVFTSEGKPYRSPFYNCDQGMLWAANYLTL